MIRVPARKSLGQNFLQDPAILERIVTVANIQPFETVVEIGPGTGALTKHLLDSPAKQVVAFELDSRVVPALRSEFSGYGHRFEVLEQDFLTVDLQSLADTVESPLTIVGNIPYYITSPILFKLLAERIWVYSATMLVQEEVAARLTAQPGTKAYGIPTVLANFFGNVTYHFRVAAGSFRPVPSVDSAVIHLDFTRNYFSRAQAVPPAGFDPEHFRQTVRGAFAMRRKTLRNNLKAFVSEAKMQELESGEVAAMLGARAETLSIADFIALTTAIGTRS